MPPRELREFVCPLLQPPLNRLFVPRPLPAFVPASDRDAHERTGQRYGPCAAFMGALAQDAARAAQEAEQEGGVLSAETRRKQKEERKQRDAARRVARGLQRWQPKEQLARTEGATGDAFKTLLVGNLSHALTERELRREFDRFGAVRRVRLVQDTKTGRPRGYGFVEFERERDVRAAYRDAEGLKLCGRRVFVDVERGRTVPGWRPRRLGGGLGRTRAGAAHQNQRHGARDPRGGPDGGAVRAPAKRRHSRSRSRPRRY